MSGLKELYGDFLIYHTDYYNDKYCEVIEKYIGKRSLPVPYIFSDKVTKLIALRDSNSLLPPDLQVLFNEWILSRKL